MKSPLKWITCCTSACLLSSAAFASLDDGRIATEPTSAQPGTMQSENQTHQYFHAYNLIGKEVRNAQDQRLGKVDDVVFSPQTGELFLAIGVSGSRYTLVPWQALTVSRPGTAGKEQLTLNATKESLQSAPTIASDQWRNLNNASFTQSIYSFYKVQPPSAMGGTSPGNLGGSGTGGAKRNP